MRAWRQSARTSDERACATERRPGQSRFYVIELLIASALVIAVIGAVAALAAPVRRAFDHGLNVAETVARARTAVATVAAEARDAGTGVVVGPTDVSFADVTSVVTSLSSSSVAMTRPTGPQGVLRSAADAGALSINLDHAKPCRIAGSNVRRMRTGNQAVIFDRTKSEPITITAVTNEWRHLTAPLSSAFDAGATVAVVEQTTFRVHDRRLVRITPGGAEQPVADHISEFTVTVAANRLDLFLRVDPLLPGAAGLALRTQWSHESDFKPWRCARDRVDRAGGLFYRWASVWCWRRRASGSQGQLRRERPRRQWRRRRLAARGA